MNNSEPLLKPKSRPEIKWLTTMLVLAFVGLSDAIYLASEYYRGSNIRCFITSGCNQVAASKYAALFGIPLGVWGALYYALLIFLILLVIDKKNNLAKKTVVYLPWWGLIFSLGLTYIQAFIIGAWCSYCLLSALICLLIFILIWPLKKSFTPRRV